MLKWMNAKKYIGRRVSVSWIISYLLVLIVPVLICLFAFVQSQNVLRAQVMDTNSLLLKQFSSQVDEIVMKMQKISSAVELNRDVNSYAYAPPENDGRRQMAVQGIREWMEAYTYAVGEEIFTFLYLVDEDRFITPTAFYDGKVFYEEYLNTEVPYDTWKTAFIAREDSAFFGDRFTFGQKNCVDALGYSRAVPAISLGGKKIILCAMYELPQFYQMIDEAAFMEEGAMAVFDKSTGILFSNGMQRYEDALYQGYGMYPEQEDTVIRRYHGRSVAVTYSTSAITGWKYVYFMPEKVFLQEVNTTFYMIVCSLFLVFLIGGGIIWYLVRKNYAPIRHLLSLLKIETEEQKNEFDLIKERISKTIEEKNMISTTLDKQNLIVQRNYLVRMLTGQLNYKQDIGSILANLNIPFRPDGGFVVLMLTVESYDEFFEGDTQLSDYEKSELIDFMFSNVFEELFQQQEYMGFVLPYSGNIFCIVSGSNPAADKIAEIVRQGQKFFEKNFQILFSAMISDVNFGYSGIYEGYQQVIETNETRIFAEEQDLVLYRDIPQQTNNNGIRSLKLDEQIFTAFIENGDSKGAVQYLTEAIHQKETELSSSVLTYRFFLFGIIELLINTIGEIYQEEDSAASLQEQLLAAMDNRMSRAEYREFFVKIIEQVCRDVGGRTKNSGIIVRITDYIQKNYADITLNITTLADSLGLSGRYISSAFKREMKMGILDYINQIRIEKAKALLAETYMTIEDVYSKVGFTNKITFIRIFKKLEGMTPSQYRTLRRD